MAPHKPPAKRTAKSTSRRKAPSRGTRPPRTAGTGARRPSPRSAKRAATPRADRQADEPMEFVELPESGSAGSSWEPDSYTPKADLRPRQRSGLFGLFRR